MYRILTFGRDYPKITGIFLLCSIIFSIARLPYLKFDFTLDRLLTENDPQAQTYDEATEVFGSDNITKKMSGSKIF